LPTLAGTVDSYFELAKAIGPGHLVYGIQFADRMQNGKFNEFASLREMAAAMVPDLLAHHRDGPICLIGYSFAAFLAIELAQQLVGHGKLVPLVVIIDKKAPSASLTPLFRIKHFIRNVGPWALRVATRSVTDADHRSRYRNAMVHKLRGGNIINFESDGWKLEDDSWYQSLPENRQNYVTKNFANARNYRVEGIYSGTILLFRQTPLPDTKPDAHPLRIGQPEDYGWGAATGARVDVVHTPGDHISIKQHPNVVHIANALRLALSECDLSRRIASSKSSG
jgi:thioesterase domain-containing protein